MKGVEGVLEDVDPDSKGFTLPESAVEPHTHFIITENTEDSNEVLGQILFAYMYTLNALIALLVGGFLLQILFKKYKKYKDNANNLTFFQDKHKVQFLVVTFLANTYITFLYVIDIVYHLSYYEHFNIFVLLKMLYGLITFGLVFLFIILYHSCKRTGCCRCSFECNCEGIVRTLLASLLTLAVALLILNILPFILLLFAHPMNTFALLGIHVALFYTETMAGILIIDRLKLNLCRCSDEYNPERQQLIQRDEENQISHCTAAKIICWAGLLLIASGFIYFSVICFYQFLFLRNLSSNNPGVDIIIKYLPSIAIGAFGFGIKATFSKKGKYEKMWLKLGELLSNNLTMTREEQIAKLQQIFRIQNPQDNHGNGRVGDIELGNMQ